MKEINECIGDIGKAESTIFWLSTSQLDFAKCQCILRITPHGLHYPRQRTIWMDHQSNGLPRLSSLISVSNGKSYGGHWCMHSIHWWLANSHQHTQKNIWSLRKEKKFVSKLVEMHFYSQKWVGIPKSPVLHDFSHKNQPNLAVFRVKTVFFTLFLELSPKTG